MKRDIPVMPLILPLADRFFESERNRIEREWEAALYARRWKPTKRAKRPYEKRVRAKFAAKRGAKC